MRFFVWQYDFDPLHVCRLKCRREFFQECRALALEFRIKNRFAGDELRQLRKRHWKHRQRPHRQHHMARIEFGGHLAARLPLADAFQAARHRRAPFFLINHFLPAPCNASHSSRRTQSASLHAASNQNGKVSAGSPDKAFRPGLPLGNFPAQHGLEQTFLVAEIMVEHPLVDGRAARDRVHARAGKTFRGEFLQRGGQNAFARAFGIARRGMFRFWRAWPCVRNK